MELWFGHGCSGSLYVLGTRTASWFGMDAIGNRAQRGGCCHGRRMDAQQNTPCVMAAGLLRPWKVRKCCSSHSEQFPCVNDP